jgi:hypothetical protein
VAAGHVVEGHVRFSSQKETLEILNRYYADFGLRPIAIPN